MLRFLIQAFHRIAREVGWIHHYHHSHGLTSLNDWYLCLLGFAPQNYEAYDLDTNDRSKYITDKTRFFGLPRVHGEYMVVLRDKSLLHTTLTNAGYEAHLPDQYRVETLDRIDEIEVEDGTYILKPVRGSSGKNLTTVTVRNGRLEVEDEIHSLAEDDDQTFVLEEQIRNPQYSRHIFDESLNTIRLVTAWNPETSSPFIVGAAHRFGTHRSAPADNFSKGGVSAPIDLSTGRLQMALDPHSDGEPTRRETHPDTGAQIQDATVQDWEELKAFVKTAASDLPNNRLIGWDVVVDETDTCTIVEANPTPDLIGLQRTKPLLTDDRMRAFLKHHSLL